MPAVPPMVKEAFEVCVNVPLPLSSVLTVRLLLLVSVTLVTVTLGMENVPVSDCVLVVNEYVPVPALKVPLFVMPPLIVTAELADVLVHVPPEAMVNKPIKIFVPVNEETVKFPLVPPP